jgi:hypothetical protein
MELHCACALAAHEPDFHRWMAGEHPRIRQTSTASPAEPGELPMYQRETPIALPMVSFA